jgi:hypothetical protein
MLVVLSEVRTLDELLKNDKNCDGIELSGVRLRSVMTFDRGVGRMKIIDRRRRK